MDGLGRRLMRDRERASSEVDVGSTSTVLPGAIRTLLEKEDQLIVDGRGFSPEKRLVKRSWQKRKESLQVTSASEKRR